MGWYVCPSCNKEVYKDSNCDIQCNYCNTELTDINKKIRETKMELINCPLCGRKVSSLAKSCPDCANPIDTSVYCPKCGSKNTEHISSSSKTASLVMFGVLGGVAKAMSNYQCLDCKNKFK